MSKVEEVERQGAQQPPTHTTCMTRYELEGEELVLQTFPHKPNAAP